METLTYVSEGVTESDAFSVEYKEFTDGELRDDLLSYIGEYRLQVKKYDYELDYYADDELSLGQVRDVNKGESMLEKASRSVVTRRRKGLPTHREEVEEQAFSFLNEQLATARDGDSLFWASPPGPKSEGYGDYGFLFQGKVRSIGLRNGQEHKRLLMTAIRVEDPTLVQYNQAMSELTGTQWQFEHEDDFLAAPIVIDEIGDYTVDHIMQKNFKFQMSEAERAMTDHILTFLRPVVDECIPLFRKGTKVQKLKMLHALENYGLALKDAYEKGDMTGEAIPKALLPQLDIILTKFSYQPPAARGSCGSSSSNPLSFGYEALLKELGIGSLEDLLNNKLFTCPKCELITDKLVSDACPGCGLTKEQHAKNGGEVC